ncbi:hypothetical protein AB0O91_00905 [Kitasatospora sp. NPDC089797]|uniref:hypothetical protein n=1 Tax=Kitasatospora sp. NPDC089797 TaxID=3155298 RepID=UPI003442E444
MLIELEGGIRYAYRDPEGSLITQVYPLLDGTAPIELPYVASFDPLDPFNESGSTVNEVDGLRRTVFAFSAPQASIGYASHLRTPPGKTVSLIPLGGVDAHDEPVANTAGLVFERSDLTGKDRNAGYLTFTGDWGMTVDGSAPGTEQELLCGVFGLERIAFRTHTTAPGAVFDRLRLMSGRPAFAERFPYRDVSLTQPADSAPPLTDRLRTSYATVVSGDSHPVEYRAQPESDPLYASSAAGTSHKVLDFLNVGVPLPAGPGFAIPLVPSSGVGTRMSDPQFPREELGPFESQVLAVARKAAVRPAALEALRAAVRDAATRDKKGKLTTATTPQGFLVTLDGARYETVTMARTEQPDFAFQHPDAELISLLQTNQLFAVVADPTHLGAFGAGSGAAFRNTVGISGWTMTANVGRASTSSDYRNVLILKFCDGTLRDRVANPDMWSDPEDFSLLPDQPDPASALTGLSQWLTGFIEQAQREAKDGNTLYTEFARVATDPNWKGLLVLRADVNPLGLPDQLRGLAAGIDFEQFCAHHFGVTVTPVTAPDGSLGISGPSSSFGLIDYQHPQFRASVANGSSPDAPLPLPVDGPYGFTVLQLQALFRNSVLTDFRSRVQLTANELFGSRVLATYGATGREPANAAVLKGTYQNQGGAPTYVIESSAPTVFTLDSNVLPTVGFNRIQFNTLTPGAGADAEIRSRLQVWGSLAFAELPGLQKGESFDLLSFGPAAQDGASRPSADGLAFSGLHLDLTSAVATPNAVAYAFDASGLAFHLTSSTAREGSLFSTFALQLDGFHIGSDDRRPRDLGYLPVDLDASIDQLKGPWYGIAYKITMGTPGALVSQAGFTSRLLVAWSPQTKAGDPTCSAFAGLQLPGAAPGAKALSLEGILKLSIGRLQLLRQPVAGSTQQKAFVLKLANIGLSVLGLAKLPPGVAIHFFLFGDPKGNGALGWYAAYVKNG